MALWGALGMVLLLAFPAAGLPALRIAIGESKPPYRFSTPPGGIEYDLLEAVVSRMGYQPVILMAPNARARFLFDEGRVDGIRAVSGPIVSQPYIQYQNAAVTLAGKPVRLHTIDDLGRYRVIGFTDARLALGPEFAAMAAANPHYSENLSQPASDQFLFHGDIDVLVCDLHIFDWFVRQAGPGASRPVTVHALFPPTRYRILFRDPVLRDRFDEALQEVLLDNPFPAIIKKYLPDPLGAGFAP